MFLRPLFVLVLALVSLTDASAGSVTLLGQPIEIVIPPGYCEIGTHPADVEMVKFVREGIGTTNRVLALFAACGELEEFRTGKRKVIDNYGWILVQTSKGELRAYK